VKALACCHPWRSRPCLCTNFSLCSHCRPSCSRPYLCRNSAPGRHACRLWLWPTAAKRPVSRLKLLLGTWRRTSRSSIRRSLRRQLLLSLSWLTFLFFGFCSPARRPNTAGSRSNVDARLNYLFAPAMGSEKSQIKTETISGERMRPAETEFYSSSQFSAFDVDNICPKPAEYFPEPSMAPADRRARRCLADSIRRRASPVCWSCPRT
jgi:hypothetical protein